MDAQQLAAKLRDDIKQLKDQKGIKVIDSDKLILLLDNLAKDETLKQNIQKDMDVNRQVFIKGVEHKQEWNIEHFRAVISRAESALKTAFLMNGGATVALLAFLGQLSVHNSTQVHNFADCLTAFVFGVFLIVSSYGVAYFAQCDYADGKDKNGDQLRRIAIILSLSSYGAFIIGALKAYISFKNF